MTKKYDFSKREDDFIRNNYLNLSISRLTRELGLSSSLIRRRKKDLDLTNRKYIKWDDIKINFLKDNYDKFSDTELSEKMGISVYAIRCTRTRYNIKKNHSKIRKRMMDEGKIKAPFAGKRLPQEMIQKRLMTLYARGNNKAWNKGKKGLQVAWNKGKKLTKEHIENRQKTMKERYPDLGIFLRGKKLPTVSKRMKSSLNPNYKGRLWKNKEYRNMFYLRPNKKEQKLIEMIKHNNLPYKYVGDFKLWIDGRNPDFINCNGQKKVIELFGEYWHSKDINPKIPLKYTLNQTVQHYKKYGFECLVIWGKELNDLNNILNKIVEFDSNRQKEYYQLENLNRLELKK